MPDHQQHQYRSLLGAILSCCKLEVVHRLSPKCCVGTVKSRAPENFAGGNSRRGTTREKKKARQSRAFDEFYFRSVHFASLAI
jgi:hypothetical protein